MINVDYSIRDGVEEFQRRFWNTWRQTGLCPDPGVYSIEFSDWLRILSPKADDFKHFMICGHDSYIEVVARTFSWTLTKD
ncbi:hypothetical protein BSF38_02651 [Paludisphaera borealis]|uniref:Uncharacterized protein n=2 Tax=Paludisphaera borealis TaxID=1387353 RepID=A0A1U7CQD8_9BACT|nr:hypothetical protein BSF38_02651 [Paludisphaera borealis]